jgi:hypothetical protein
MRDGVLFAELAEFGFGLFARTPAQQCETVCLQCEEEQVQLEQQVVLKHPLVSTVSTQKKSL